MIITTKFVANFVDVVIHGSCFGCDRFLVNCGLLVVRDIGKAASWWFAIPSVGPYVKQLAKGRSTILQMIKRAKHQELLQSELEARKLSASKLGMNYHLHDILGSELVRRYVTLVSNGTLGCQGIV